jgi:hypothetical protein
MSDVAGLKEFESVTFLHNKLGRDSPCIAVDEVVNVSWRRGDGVERSAQDETSSELWGSLLPSLPPYNPSPEQKLTPWLAPLSLRTIVADHILEASKHSTTTRSKLLLPRPQPPVSGVPESVNTTLAFCGHPCDLFARQSPSLELYCRFLQLCLLFRPFYYPLPTPTSLRS